MKKTLLIIFSLIVLTNCAPAFSQEQDIYSIAYINRLQDKIKTNWNPDYETDKKTVIIFTVDKDGQITESKITESSEDKEFDAMAMFALRNSEPFEALPKTVEQNEIKVQFTFTRNTAEAVQLEEQTTTQAQQTEETNDKEIPINNLSKESSEEITLPWLKNIQEKLLFKPYVNNLQKQIKKNWFPYGTSGKKVATASFKIKADGKISNLKIHKSSNDKKFDELALRAISNSAPFESLPEKSERKSIDVLFTFNYDSNNPKFEDYEGNYGKQLEIILENCLPPKNYLLERYLVLKITIEKDGKVAAVEIQRSSNDKKFDATNISAIKSCVFPPIPDEISKGRITINYVIKISRPSICGEKMISKSFWYTLDDNLLNRFRGLKN